MTYINAWFNGRVAIKELPEDCISDCSQPGMDASDAVTYWVKRLQFDGPAWLIREHLKGYGAWESSELCNHKSNLRKLLWIWANDCKEDPDNGQLLYLMY
jgi:hypothetical protein